MGAVRDEFSRNGARGGGRRDGGLSRGRGGAPAHRHARRARRRRLLRLGGRGRGPRSTLWRRRSRAAGPQSPPPPPPPNARCAASPAWRIAWTPGGRRVELFYGLDPAGGAFSPGRPIAGFNTGALGLGHVPSANRGRPGNAPRSTARRWASASATGATNRTPHASCIATRDTILWRCSSAERRACTT